MHKRAPKQTREKILAAAAEILAEEGIGARLSVRAVAGRAEVSIGTMRHHFPTQSALRDELMSRIGDWMFPDAVIDDHAQPASERLRACLGQLLGHVSTGQDARDTLTRLVSTFVDVDLTPRLREAYLAIEADGQRRMEGWLNTLAQEGHLASADVPRHARFLEAVLNGLTMQRALPAPDAFVTMEAEILDAAIATVLTKSS